MTNTLSSPTQPTLATPAPLGTFRTQRTRRPITPGETVYLDGQALLDPTAVGSTTRFAWRIMRRPEGSQAVLRQASSPRVNFEPDVAGRYLIRLEARTATGPVRVIKEVRVSQDETTPVSVAKAESTLVMTGAPIRLSGAGSENPLAGSLSYEWRITAAPAGSIATLSYAASEAPMIFPDLEGRYEVALIARNAAGAGTIDKVAITVVSPVELAELTQVSIEETPAPINFGRTYSPAELEALKRAVHVTTTRTRSDFPSPTAPSSGKRPGEVQETLSATSSNRYASLIGHIRVLLRDGVDSIARQVDSAHDFQQPAVSRR
jgi:hypothetical protein